MRRIFTSPVLALLLLVAPAILAAILYPGLPETIPIHFNAKGQADGFGPKSSIWIHISILSVVGLGVYLLISNIHKIDPKKTANVSVDTYKTLALAITLFLSIINASIVLYMSDALKNLGIQNIVLPSVGLLLAVIGYFMRNIKPNYFIGLRLPWTLEDDENWAATHQLAAKLWIPGGIIIAVVSFALPFMTAFIITVLFTAIMIIVPAVYSYRFFKHKKV
ncbi:SdpI family protein [Sediminibacterium goheungense]|uniref:Putative membrane protein n=1 Tax=Sediminibacterium goheungense TaxID=1086393 RepID=A0A4R6J1H3_9BACT|nr:SdpI family protein [Sediminibacterium goheungense]TDO29099.1 putative membrane protein [Sediminibacterium goheungense]